MFKIEESMILQDSFVDGFDALASHLVFKGGKRIKVGAGWLTVLVDLNEKLERISPNYQLLQVNAVDGRMRIFAKYESTGNNVDNSAAKDEFYSLIYEAESRTRNMCEVCGSHGSPRLIGYFVMTRCVEHGI